MSAMFVIGSLACVMALEPAQGQTGTKPSQPQPQPRPQNPPPGQSDAELRRRNQELESQIQELASQMQELASQLQDSQLRIIELERQLGEARRGRATPPPSSTQPSTQPDDRVTIDESLPTSSPRALLNAVKESFAQTYGKSNPGTPGDVQRGTYIKNVNRWRSWINRNFRGPMSWHVRMIASQVGERGERTLTLIAVDPISATKLGDQFEVKLPRSLADRLAWLQRSDNQTGMLVLKGTLVPDVRVNEERSEKGPFDRPPFIGPFVELTYDIEVKSLMPAEQEKDEQPGGAATPTAPKAGESKGPATRPAK